MPKLRHLLLRRLGGMIAQGTPMYGGWPLDSGSIGASRWERFTPNGVACYGMARAEGG